MFPLEELLKSKEDYIPPTQYKEIEVKLKQQIELADKYSADIEELNEKINTYKSKSIKDTAKYNSKLKGNIPKC